MDNQKHPELDTAIFGAGCFWGVEEAFRTLPGVAATKVGYSGGTVTEPSYEEVCTGKTGHAEVVHVTFDPTEITYQQLLDVFWTIHDPTQMNCQGPDVGTQYRSTIFYNSSEQEDSAKHSKKVQSTSGQYRRPIVTEIAPTDTFWPAEDYHQQYLAKRGMGACPSNLKS